MIQFPISDDWYGCYGKSWKGIISDASFKHPAKFSQRLIERIYRYLLDENLLQSGDTIFDPFGGVALGAFHALQFGLNWLGVELEQQFVDLGRENLALWESQYRGNLPNWTGQAALLQGDSRRLLEILRGQIGIVVSSPPYHNQFPSHDNFIAPHDTMRLMDKSKDAYGDSNGQLANLPEGDFQAVVSSPPFAGNSGGCGEASRNGIDAALFDRHQGAMVGGIGERESGNLASMPQSDFDAVITSSPFVDSVGSDDPKKRGGILASDPKRRNDKNLTGTYGDSDGQLGAMKAGEIEGIVSSPPYENSVNQSGKTNDSEARIERMRQAGIDVSKKVNIGGANGIYNQPQSYGVSDGQIGATSGDTFWSAARIILEQCHQALKANGVAVFVTKDFVKDGQRVSFTDQWSQLCVAIGFEPYAHFRAWQVKPGPVQMTMIGEDVDHTKEYKSFFRRNAEKKGAPRIDWESVLIFRKVKAND